MAMYRKKPVVIEARQWTGGDKNALDLIHWVGGVASHQDGATLIIETLGGDHKASLGDFIIRGVNGEFYPCKPDIFAKTYEPVGEDA